MWFLIAALSFNGQLLDQVISPEGYETKEACLAVGHARADGYDVETRMPEDGDEYYVINFEDGSQVFYACIMP